MTVPLATALFSCALFGFRHGFDYDHIAAISDIAGIQAKASDTMRLGLMYAFGHAATVAALGALVIGFRVSLPASMDLWAERFVGATLIVFALYVLNTMVRSKGKARPKSRATLVFGWFHRQHTRTHAWLTGQHRDYPAQTEVGASACFGMGIIHGLGAETPSQIGVFLLAANLGGMRNGFVGLLLFLAGLLVMNTLMTASAAGVFSAGRIWSKWYPIFTGFTAAYSLAVGMVLLLGYSDLLWKI